MCVPQAAPFDHLLLDTPRTDCPKTLPAAPKKLPNQAAVDRESSAPLNDLQRDIVQVPSDGGTDVRVVNVVYRPILWTTEHGWRERRCLITVAHSPRGVLRGMQAFVQLVGRDNPLTSAEQLPQVQGEGGAWIQRVTESIMRGEHVFA